jgi:hypothetical protein
VVGLHAPVKHAKGRAGGGGEGGADAGERPRLAERREAPGGAERDVGRAAGDVGGAAPVGDGAPPGPRWPAGAGAAAAPGPDAELELPGLSRHLELGRYYIKLAPMSSGALTRAPRGRPVLPLRSS